MTLSSRHSALIDFAKRLGRDRRGNTLLLMAAGMLPVIAAIGAGVDMTRGYMAQARLQEAVDAAALAGRKAMDGTDLSTAKPTVDKFLAFNFPNGAFNSSGFTSSLKTTADGALVVDASATVPTVMMSAFGIKSMPVAAESSAKRSGSNIDVVLVLDVTGSMDDSIGGTKKIVSLQKAANDFLTTIDATRTQLAASGLRVRVGIVPYSQTVNIGRYLRQESASYVSLSGSNANWWSTLGKPVRNLTTKQWSNGTQEMGSRNLDVTRFVTDGGAAGTAYSNAYAWKGCVEMRPTVQTITASSSPSSIPSGAWDLLDVEPGTSVNGQIAPAWRPYLALPQASSNAYGPPTSTVSTSNPWNFQFHYKVKANSAYFTNNGSTVVYEAAAQNPTQPNSSGLGGSAGGEAGPNQNCPFEVKPLSDTRQTQTQLATYIASLRAVGSTLHDVGMFWGLAMISPGRPFPNDDMYNGREVKRYIIFMTDGEMNPEESSYSAYGLENSEHRVATSGDTTAVHNKRFDMLCEAAKRTGVNISTISFGTSVTTQLTNCATTTDQAYLASNGNDLSDIFKQIAQNIGYLRISQ